MPIEIFKKEDGAEGFPAAYEKSMKILGEGGIDPEEAFGILEKIHDEFHSFVKPSIIKQAAERVLDESKNIKDADILKIFRKEVFRAQREIDRSLRSDPDKEMRVIFKGPGNTDITESSNN